MEHEPIHEMFHRAAGRFGDHTAVEWGEHRVTYRQLAAQALELARALRTAGAAPGSLVAVLATRTADVIAAMLATLEAGCAFVPLDVASPATTVPSILAEVQPRVWLVEREQAGVAEWLGAGSIVSIPPPESWGDGTAAAPRAPLPPPDPDSLCYVYFTSGSTGRPKGIAGRLKAIDHFVRWEIETFGVGEGTRVSQLTSPAFDAFLRDAFVPLAAGGTVCAPPSREILLDGDRLARWLASAGIQLLHCTPSLFRAIVGEEPPAEPFPELRHVLLAGEPLLPSDVRRWRAAVGDRAPLVNLYGPSETTMIKLFHRVSPQDGEAKLVPIGRPMPGAKAIVVDEQGRPCPPGKLGEIYIRTPYRSLGYLNNPELTAEVFVQNPFSDRPGDLVYKTGDLGRIREDGCFEFYGRRDHQVKVRGVRIEIAPIEDLLRSHDAVADAAVVGLADAQGNNFLCAYLVLRREVAPALLGEYLRERLPPAMVPSAFMVLESLPRTLSGKVDRRNLPKPGEAKGWMRNEYVAPRTVVEERLSGIFSELLKVPRIGAHDNFFQLGGHSLSASLLLSRIRSSFGVELPLLQVFQTPTVEALALNVTRLQLAEEDPDDMAALVREIRSLSDEEIDVTFDPAGGSRE
jgi:amino acid adenylation domain-containing protein